MKNCYGEHSWQNLACNDCDVAEACRNMPACYKNYKTESAFCTDHCRHADNCSGSKAELDAIGRLRVFRRSGKLSFKEFVDLSMPIVKQKADERAKEEASRGIQPLDRVIFDPYVPTMPKPRRRKKLQPRTSEEMRKRMDYINN